MLNDLYHKVFDRIPILGMIHLSGDDPVKRALEEISIFEEEGVDGAIVENYHGSSRDVIKTLDNLSTDLVVGINFLPNEFNISFPTADRYKADFIQLDHVAGQYSNGSIHLPEYIIYKEQYPKVIVLGGVWPKYYTPIDGSYLETDLRHGMERAEAIVVTGEGTGQETPFDKIKRFREIIGDHPLVIGAGLTPDNAYEQLCISDGAIVGTCFKNNDNTHNPIDRTRVKDFMSVVKEARAYQEKLSPKHL